MKVCLLASGSRGNCAFVEADGCRLLIDAGLSGIETERRLVTIGVTAEDLDAILVTHEHHDHVGGIGPLARRYDLSVYIDAQTFEALPKLGRINDLNLFSAGEQFQLNDLVISSFSTTHDAVNPVGFAIESAEGKIGFATDLGVPTRLVAEHLKNSRAVVIEANHDDQMLQDGPYPWALKERIRSRHGHLSNRDSIRLLEEIMWPGLEALFLAHLSEENNCPDLTRSVFHQTFDQSGHNPQVIVGSQNHPSNCFATEVSVVAEDS